MYQGYTCIMYIYSFMIIFSLNSPIFNLSLSAGIKCCTNEHSLEREQLICAWICSFVALASVNIFLILLCFRFRAQSPWVYDLIICMNTISHHKPFQNGRHIRLRATSTTAHCSLHAFHTILNSVHFAGSCIGDLASFSLYCFNKWCV